MSLDPLYLILSLPALLLSALFSARVKTTFAKYSKTAASCGLTGAEAATQMLARSGVTGVQVRLTGGLLTDHYNPADKTLNLSQSVYNGRSLASLGVACHEAGHALQHAEGYKWMSLRSALVPAANIGSRFSYIVFVLGFLFQAPVLLKVGIAMFCAAVAFSLVTLPVEWDASARAKKRLAAAGMLSPSEHDGAAAVLNAAFLTYVGAAVSSIATLLYYLIRSGLLSSNNRR